MLLDTADELRLEQFEGLTAACCAAEGGNEHGSTGA